MQRKVVCLVGANPLLRQLPRVDDLLACPALAEALHTLPYPAVLDSVRAVIDEQRQALLSGAAGALPPLEAFAAKAAALAAETARPSLRRVINATGVVLHTNLGRAPLSDAAARAAYQAARGYCNLEYDLESGTRGARGERAEALLARLCGAEAALVVNNNAAALFLALNTLANQREVVLSRGELVEIGGSFRVPTIIGQSGARLVEVGTTNKTHLADYASAIGENTAALLKVHPSNYRVVGFCGEVPLEELAGLAHAHGLPLLHDLGSGALFPLDFLRGEPTAVQSVLAGADVTCFSGDKLLGGPQAGILLGRKDLLDLMRKSPLARVVRLDKLNLAALEATLCLYLEPERARRELPVLAMLCAPPQELERRAMELCGRLLQAVPNNAFTAELVEEHGQVGGGSAPSAELPTTAVALSPHRLTVDELEDRLRRNEPPIVGRISHGSLLFDVRTLADDDFAPIVSALAQIFTE